MTKAFAEKRFFKWQLDDRSVSLRAKSGSYGGGSEVLVVEPQKSYAMQAIGIYKSSESASALKMRDYKDSTDLIVEGDDDLESVVRRLTPKEAERLQGMPDDWSKYGTDEDGNIYELPDSARYRIQGNGIATPFWKYLMKRISAQYEGDPTLGSLFDGQGSFPMIWENINGPGTALWSSEIDKHATAVAKYHFPDDDSEA